MHQLRVYPLDVIYQMPTTARARTEKVQVRMWIRKNNSGKAQYAGIEVPGSAVFSAV
jgi:hypothetical protein